MKVLLDTNVVIERETQRINQKGVGSLFYWLDKLSCLKCIHKLIFEEIEKHKDKKVKETFKIKLESYTLLKTEAPISKEVELISKEYDVTQNDLNDTKLLNELFNNRVDILITEDNKIHEKARLLGIAEKVFHIESFLEKANAENPDFIEYRNLIAKRMLFGKINLNDIFFDTFRRDYPNFNDWYNSKSDEYAYVCSSSKEEVLAFLYLKKEDEKEDYYSEGKRIEPLFQKKKRLKIGTFKVVLNGYKLGERFLKIIFDNALKQKVDEIYVTIFDNDDEKKRLIELLKEWGFKEGGTKTSKAGVEKVYIRNFTKFFDSSNPKFSYPYISRNFPIHFVPINPAFHTTLFPDSMLKTESADNFIENKACMNSISKVYVSHSKNREINKGDILLFYRMKDNGPARFTSVITTLGVVECIITNIKNEEEFISLCGKRSVFNKDELSSIWNKFPSYKPFIINFLYDYSFPKRTNLQKLIDMKIIKDIMSIPKPFDKISKEDFLKIIDSTETDTSILT